VIDGELPRTITQAGIVALVAWVGVVVLLWLLLRRGQRLLPLDQPNERSLHASPVPRIGGMVMMIVLLPLILMQIPGASAWALPAGVIAIVSAIDDFRGLPVALRFAIQAALAGWTVVGLDLPWAVATVAWLAVVWMANLYNFMDGSDGLAGGMAFFGFGAYGVAAGLAGEASLSVAGFAIAATALGFLGFNFHPARVFMGDAGSVTLGFLAGVLGLLGWRTGCWGPMFPVLVFSPFIVDATVTLLRRLSRGERIWKAHRSHYYQRLILSGVGHRATAYFEYALMAAAGASAVWATRTDNMLAVMVAWIPAYVFLACWVDGRFGRTSAGS
jgi:UDP-N-acetylmuramyl pentapeptide phosphotransferase/UDP-N-acetylglucosamine-1-phosphate transferase